MGFRLPRSPPRPGSLRLAKFNGPSHGAGTMAPADSQKRPNMQQIAARAGVSKSTVSLALRNDPRLKPATIRKVHRAADELGYRTNALVAHLMAHLRQSRTKAFQSNVALMNCSGDAHIFDWHTFSDFRAGAEERADQLGYGIDTFWLADPEMKPSRMKQILETRNIRGVVFAAHHEPGGLDERYHELWEEFSCAIVGVGRVDPPLPCAANDHYETARQAARKAFELGYHHPGLVIENRLDRLLNRKFTAGFTSVERNPTDEGSLPWLDFDQIDPRGLMAWKETHGIDLIVCTRAEVRAWLEAEGLHIPADIGLIHLDWFPELADWAGFNQNNRVVGAAAADIVINQIHRNEVGYVEYPKLVLIESDWVPGDSVQETPPGNHADIAP